MNGKKTGLKADVDKECVKMNTGEMSSFHLSDPNLGMARSGIEDIHSHIKEKEKDCKKLENERKILDFHK